MLPHILANIPPMLQNGNYCIVNICSKWLKWIFLKQFSGLTNGHESLWHHFIFIFFLVVWTFVNNKMKTPDCWKKLTSNILVSIFFVLQTILSWNPLTFTFRYYVLKFVSALVHIFDTHVKLIRFQFILQYLVIHKKDLFSYLIDFSYFPESWSTLWTDQKCTFFLIFLKGNVDVYSYFSLILSFIF
jgi:hypothetical protein